MSDRAGSAAPAQNGGPAAAPERSQSLRESYDLACKVMLLGDSGVGKTCFLLQFKDGAFLSGTFIATVGIDFRALNPALHASASMELVYTEPCHKVQDASGTTECSMGKLQPTKDHTRHSHHIKPVWFCFLLQNKVVAVDGVKVKLQIWDTAGQERFRSVTHAYYRDAQALLLFYDITSKKSFDNIRAWLTEIHEYAQKDVVIMLLGNKADVSSERVIRMEDGESLAREYGVPFMETSAKTGMNVELAFLAIAKELKQRAVQQLDGPRFQIQDYIESQKKKSSCCSFM
ncbi:ras-related protein Rab-37 isoform 1-T1 [Pangshura tecta]